MCLLVENQTGKKLKVLRIDNGLVLQCWGNSYCSHHGSISLWDTHLSKIVLLKSCLSTIIDYQVWQCNEGDESWDTVCYGMHKDCAICKSHFPKVFLSLLAQRNGFVYGFWPFIRFDGCHLRGSFGKVLSIVVALDANRGLFPLVVAICERETLSS